MEVTIDDSQHRAFLAKLARLAPKMQTATRNDLRVVALETKKMVKLEMPKDSTRAANTWAESPTQIVHYVGRLGPNPSTAADGIWEEKDGQGEWSIRQGSTVHYVPGLNEGSSKQAPAGFIDANAKRGEEKLAQEIEDSIIEILTA